eukprot:1904755-Prymnesium_polylepis.1
MRVDACPDAHDPIRTCAGASRGTAHSQTLPQQTSPPIPATARCCNREHCHPLPPPRYRPLFGPLWPAAAPLFGPLWPALAHFNPPWPPATWPATARRAVTHLERCAESRGGDDAVDNVGDIREVTLQLLAVVLREGGEGGKAG